VTFFGRGIGILGLLTSFSYTVSECVQVSHEKRAYFRSNSLSPEVREREKTADWSAVVHFL
jgi:hypothetical protein